MRTNQQWKAIMTVFFIQQFIGMCFMAAIYIFQAYGMVRCSKTRKVFTAIFCTLLATLGLDQYVIACTPILDKTKRDDHISEVHMFLRNFRNLGVGIA